MFHGLLGGWTGFTVRASKACVCRYVVCIMGASSMYSYDPLSSGFWVARPWPCQMHCIIDIIQTSWHHRSTIR